MYSNDDTNSERYQPLSTREPPSKRYPSGFEIKCYGKSSALNFCPDKTEQGFITVRIEGADLKDPNSKKFDWENKLILQVTKTEILDLASVMLGYKGKCHYSNHGQNSTVPGQAKQSKGFEAEIQGLNVFFKVFGGGKKTKAVPIPLLDAMQVGHMIINLYADNHRGLSCEVVLETIKQYVAIVRHNNKIKAVT